jgi:hypothetical protein
VFAFGIDLKNLCVGASLDDKAIDNDIEINNVINNDTNDHYDDNSDDNRRFSNRITISNEFASNG